MKLKSLTKPSHQDRSASKKPKSQKRKRRYSSSDSSSADSARKKPRKSKKSKKSKKNLKKKPRKFSVSPSPSSCSSDYSASSCSTCEKGKGSRSRSPIPRSNGDLKPRKKGGGSYGGKYKGKERGRSRRRSPSCSTCSRSSSYSERSRSPKRSKRVLKDKERARKSEVEEREKVIPSYDDIVPPSKEEEKRIQKETSESELVAEEGNNVAPVKNENDDGAKKTGVVDAELVLRQKALENFIKFHKVKKCGISAEPNKEVNSVPGVMAAGKEIKEPTLDEPTKVITDIDLKEKGEIMPDISVKRPKLRSIIVIPTEKEVYEDNNIEVPNGIKGVADHIKEELDRGSEPTNPNFNLEVSNPSLLVVNGLRKDETITAAAVEQSGMTQYEKKTFSRLHEGETVQVSYKVYIPKKAPALARRKLQRGETSAS